MGRNADHLNYSDTLLARVTERKQSRFFLKEREKPKRKEK